MKKTVLTLFQLDDLYNEKIYKEHGKKLTSTHPMELTPMYFSYCKKNPAAWNNQKEMRLQQLIYLEIAETHLIDYYENTEPIVPY